jgi:AbrB family looped-hinge helix DNA binding protein
MITTVTGKNQVTIPAELARALNIKAGTRLEWTPEADGVLRVKPLPSRGDLARRLAGIGRPWLKPGDDPIADLIRERVADDEEEHRSSC